MFEHCALRKHEFNQLSLCHVMPRERRCHCSHWQTIAMLSANCIVPRTIGQTCLPAVLMQDLLDLGQCVRNVIGKSLRAIKLTKFKYDDVINDLTMNNARKHMTVCTYN